MNFNRNKYVKFDKFWLMVLCEPSAILVSYFSFAAFFNFLFVVNIILLCLLYVINIVIKMEVSSTILAQSP